MNNIKAIAEISMLFILSACFARAEEKFSNPLEPLKALKITYVRDANIWVANGDGTDQKRIIENGQFPSWSPDRKQIAFVRDRNIWVATADGSNQRPLTFQWKKDDPLLKSELMDIKISWNPRYDSVTFSHQELFEIERVNGIEGLTPYPRNAPKNIIMGCSIFDVQVNGEAPKKALPRYDLYGHEGGTDNYFVDQNFPSWSRSGKRLAFTRAGDIWVTEVIEKEDKEDIENFDVTRVAAVASYDEPTLRASRNNLMATTLSWTPDEKQILYGYERYEGSGTEEVHLLDVESGKDIRLLGDTTVIRPTLSPDGKFIVYQSWVCADDKSGKAVRACLWVASVDGEIKQEIVSNGIEANW